MGGLVEGHCGDGFFGVASQFRDDFGPLIQATGFS